MEAFYQDKKVKLYQADVLEWALTYKQKIDAGNALPFHSICADPPYGLGDPPPADELLKTWLGGEEYNTGCGFMSARWDVVPGPKYWRALLDIVFPGGYMFLFSGTRTADLLGISCRLGGWEPFDRIASFAWVQAQGMAKGVNISKALDASAVVPCPDCGGKGDQCETCGGTGQVVGVEREVVGLRTDADGRCRAAEPHGDTIYQRDIYGEDLRAAKDIKAITAAATPLAKQFDGYNTGLAPKQEPIQVYVKPFEDGSIVKDDILLFRKPREGRTFAQCAREFGSGGLNVDGCRVGTQKMGGYQVSPGGMLAPSNQRNSGYRPKWDKEDQPFMAQEASGRWPPNVHYSHVAPTDICPACSGDGCDECHGVGMVGGCRRVGSKRVKSDKNSPRHPEKKSNPFHMTADSFDNSAPTAPWGYADADGLETVDDWLCHPQCAIQALDEMAGERPVSGTAKLGKQNRAGRAFFGGCESGYKSILPNDSGSASRFYPNHDWSYEIAERLAGETPFKYCAKSSRGERNFGLAQFLPRTRNERKRRHQDLDGSWLERATCGHPTIKPLSLLIWLCKLAKPPDMFKPRICIPFAGALSETIAARLAGWTEIHAIEREKKYCVWGAARYKAMDKWADLTGKTDPAEIRKLGQAADEREARRGDERQTTMFDFLGEADE
jgi:hypothetical protein